MCLNSFHARLGHGFVEPQPSRHRVPGPSPQNGKSASPCQARCLQRPLPPTAGRRASRIGVTLQMSTVGPPPAPTSVARHEIARQGTPTAWQSCSNCAHWPAPVRDPSRRRSSRRRTSRCCTPRHKNPRTPPPAWLGRHANVVALVGQQVCPAGHCVGFAWQLAGRPRVGRRGHRGAANSPHCGEHREPCRKAEKQPNARDAGTRRTRQDEGRREERKTSWRLANPPRTAPLLASVGRSGRGASMWSHREHHGCALFIRSLSLRGPSVVCTYWLLNI